MSVADEIRQRLDLVDVVSESVALKKAGRSFKGLCPFHQEKTPSFIVFPETQTWHCFGACGEGGDLFNFVMKREGVDFSEALRILAQRAGISLHAQDPAAIEEAQTRDRLHVVLEQAAAFYVEQLATPAGEVARDYLAKRGVGDEIAAEFRLGYSPSAWRSLSTRLMTEGYTRDELSQAGLIIERDEGGFYDRFRHRLMFPIWDSRGRVVGFGARSLDGTDPKYLNSSQTPLFDKGKLLYGLHKARPAIMASGTVVIVEGYMDAIAAHEAGYRNVVAGMGTALTEEQLQSVARAAKRFVLALDADAAGSAATLRGVAVASEALQVESSAPTFEGGLLRFEQRLEAEIRVAVLPEGLDPDDLIRRDAAAWETLIAEAKPLVSYIFDVAQAEEDLSDAKGKSRFVRRLVPVIAQVADTFERAHHIERLARLLGVEAGLVEAEVASARSETARDRSRATQRPPGAVAIDEPLGLEQYALGYLLGDHEALPEVEQALREFNIEPLSEQDFTDPAYRAIFQRLLDGTASDAMALRASLDAASRRAYDDLVGAWAQLPESDDIVLRHSVIRAVLSLREKRLRTHSSHLRRAIESAEDAIEARLYGQEVVQVTRQLDLVMDMLDRTTMLRTAGNGP